MHDRSGSPLFSPVVIAMFGFVKQAQNKCDCPPHREAATAATPEELGRAMLKFVEALAIADARRDHLIAIGISTDRYANGDEDRCRTKASDI